MAAKRRSKTWDVDRNDATPESIFLNRRRFLRSIGAIGGAVAFGGIACKPESMEAGAADATPSPGSATAAFPKQIVIPNTPTSDLYPAKRNETFKLDRPITDEVVAATHNNFYEFTTDKGRVWELVSSLKIRPWTVEVGGLVKNPKRYDVDDLIRKMPLEERLYRHRCVETWAMAVPWTGFPLRELIKLVEPKSNAKYIRFTSFNRPKEVPTQGMSTYKWPYYEGLNMDEANNELAMMVTGIYGHELPTQHGAPIRLVVPWKYGFKSIKSIERIEFVEEEPGTFWHDLQPLEYSFHANVEPNVPHPRWSQAREWLIPDRGDSRPTQLYNGYQDQVAKLYG
ncbi:MAG: protein-methionine-sulfoxide reductase catalytic subunit MsrP [Phycisphaerae bacterium]|nr:protein-methionine-sulfoxide reductase catalytic subunit MsrP [Phycisphaerales bacterium]